MAFKCTRLTDKLFAADDCKHHTHGPKPPDATSDTNPNQPCCGGGDDKGSKRLASLDVFRAELRQALLQPPA
jgi:hypothetical protein